MRYFFLCTSVFLGLASNVAAQSSPSFYEEMQRPVTISAHQNFPGFWETLRTLDAQSNVIKFDPNWQSFWDADVWVYFLKNRAELGNLTEFTQRAAKYGGPVKAGTFSKRTDADLKGNRKVMFQFIFLSELRAEWKTQAGCRAAVIVHHAIVGGSIGSEKIDECSS